MPGSYLRLGESFGAIARNPATPLPIVGFVLSIVRREMRIENAHVASNEKSSDGFEDNLLVAHGISVLLTGVDGAISVKL